MAKTPPEPRLTAKNLTEVGEVLGLSLAHVQRLRKSGLPGKTGAYDLREVVPWYVSRLRKQAERCGRTSPALEAFRRERAKMARLERERMEASLVDIELLEDGFARGADRVRKAGEQLQKLFGPQAWDVLNEAIDDAEREAALTISQATERVNGRRQPD